MVRIDCQGFDETRCWFESAGAIAKAKRPRSFVEAEHLALDCLEDSKTEDELANVDLTAAIGLLMVRTTSAHRLDQVDAAMWIYHSLFKYLEKLVLPRA